MKQERNRLSLKLSRKFEALRVRGHLWNLHPAAAVLSCLSVDRRNALQILSFVLILTCFFPACAIKTGPDLLVPPAVTDRPPVLRIGEITESLTGSWTQDPHAGSSVIRNYLTDALKEPKVASRFSPESSNLTMNIDLVSDHESDQPRLSNLGGLSLLTFGVIPLNYFSEWNVDCKVNIVSREGVQVADYVFQERGTYRIWAFPPTMVTLLGAGIRGNQDARAIFLKVAAGLSAKIADAVDKDYEKLAAHVKKLEAPKESPIGSTTETPKPLII